ncbi:MAG: UDP-N-acetylmuramoyl-L-alanyl-D-glutamate--2,6-diaminopimelate ligase [Rubrivivax sp.]|nr:UDP-N-acetylmuramoyl-L-alanyl-D-glutamate--2,6-diaminopimelate ligase [Rubrivivax sp.]
MAATLLASTAEAVRFVVAHGCTALRADSRRVQPGDGFIAWPGLATDGRRFVPQALAAGAAACLVEAAGAQAFAFDDPRIAALPGLKAATGPIAAAFYGEPSTKLDLIATTGTNGKTSTAWFTAQALTLLGRRAGLIGTLGIGEASAHVEPTGLTTPDPVTLQAALADFVARGFAACALEASSIGLVEQRLAGTRIAVALFTNFTRDHLDYHGSMDAYWAAKRALFDWPGLRAAVINVDDEQGRLLAAELRGRPLELWTVSTRGPARLRARALRHAAAGLAFDAVEGDAVMPVVSTLVGPYNASNLLGVMAGLRALGFTLADIAAVVPRLTPVPGRLQPVASGAADEPAVLVDYAHTPDALEQVLQALRPLVDARGGRLWCVFGCGGNRDATKRPLMGAIAERLADRVVLTSDNPRDEPPALILSQILAGMHGVARHEPPAVMADRAEAIAHAVTRAAAADVVLIAGKGHEDTQEVAGVKRPFQDADVALAALRRRGVAA